MRTQDFIAKTVGTYSDRERRCSSVFTDYKGNVYSYGYHYPLTFIVGGMTFVNCTGYSSTTAKHIAWAKRAADYDYVAVWLPTRYGHGTIDYSLGDMLEALNAEHDDIVKRVVATKRKNTKKYQALLEELNDCASRIERVKAAL